MKPFLMAAALLAATPALADQPTLSMSTMLPHCRNSLTENTTGAFAQGYCAGGVEALIIGNNMICPGPRWSVWQGVQIVIDYAEKVPTRWNEHYLRIAFAALVNAWPCPQAQTPAVRGRTY